MALLKKDETRLASAGFTSFECGLINADLISRPQVFDLDAKPWQDALGRRALWVLRERKLGKTFAQISAKANARYAVDEEASPWEFVRAAYHPVERIDDYREAARKKAEEKVRKLYGRRSGRKH